MMEHIHYPWIFFVGVRMQMVIPLDVKNRLSPR